MARSRTPPPPPSGLPEPPDHGLPLAAIAELRRLEKERGRLYPEDVVNAARAPANPLHEFFEWDNAVAANRWRLQQAAILIRKVKVTVYRMNIPITIPRYLRDPTIKVDPDKAMRPYRNFDHVVHEADRARAIVIEEMKRVDQAVRRAQNVAAALKIEEDIDAISILAQSILGRFRNLNEDPPEGNA